MKYFKMLYIWQLMLLLNISWVYGQSVQSDSIDAFSLQDLMAIKITSSSRVEQKIEDASSKIFVITRAQIKNRGYFSMMDLLRDLPYFQVQSEHGHWTKGGIVNLRGHRSGDSGNNKFLILVDGVRISDEGAEGIYLGLNSIPLDMVKQVEVNYGPNSTIYGRDAYAGLINIVTLKDKFTTFGARYGSFNSRFVFAGFRKYFSADIIAQILFSNYMSDEQDPTHSSISYKLRKNFPQSPYTGIFYRASDNKYFNFHLAIKNFNFTAMIFRITGSETYGSSPNLYATEYSTVSRQKNQIFHLNWNKRFANNSQIKINGDFKNNEFDPQTSNLYLSDLDRPPVLVDSQWITDPLFGYGGRKYYYFRIRSFKGGLEYQAVMNNTISFVTGFDAAFVYGIPVISEGKGGKPFTSDKQKKRYEHFFSSMGFYAEMLYKLSDKVRVSLGGRLDENSAFPDEFMPRAALLFNSDKNHIKLILSKGYLAPSITQKYFTSVTNFSLIAPNNNLKSERNTSIEFDMMRKMGRGHVGVNLFYNKLKNGISQSTFTGDSAWVYIQSDSFFVPVYKSQNSSTGYRMGFSLHFRQKLVNNLNVSVNYTYLHGEDKIWDETLSISDNLIAENSVQSGVEWSSKNFNLYWGLNYLSHRRILTDYGETDYAALVDKKGRVHFDPVWFSHLTLRITGIAKGLTLTGRVKNLFNQEFYGQTISSSWGNPKILQDKIRFDAGIEYVF